jgi:hypothetical protein
LRVLSSSRACSSTTLRRDCGLSYPRRMLCRYLDLLVDPNMTHTESVSSAQTTRSSSASQLAQPAASDRVAELANNLNAGRDCSLDRSEPWWSSPMAWVYLSVCTIIHFMILNWQTLNRHVHILKSPGLRSVGVGRWGLVQRCADIAHSTWFCWRNVILSSTSVCRAGPRAQNWDGLWDGLCHIIMWHIIRWHTISISGRQCLLWSYSDWLRCRTNSSSYKLVLLFVLLQ